MQTPSSTWAHWTGVSVHGPSTAAKYHLLRCCALSLGSQCFLADVPMVQIEDEHVSAEKIDSVLAEICAMFLNIHPNSGTSASYKAVIILFPSLPLDKAPILIDGAQQRGKPSFVAKGLMLGEFHALNTTIGLRCPMGSTFFPLQTPIPALAIRSLVSSDIVFLDRPNYAPEIRGSFLQSYYSRFSTEPSVTPSVTEPNATPITVISRPPSPSPQQTAVTSPAKLQTTTPASLFIYAFSLFLLVVISLSYAWLRPGMSAILF